MTTLVKNSIQLSLVNMPNRSDSAGKIHEYFTYLNIKKIFWIKWASPYDQNRKLFFDLFSEIELERLEKCSELTALLIEEHIIKLHPWDLPVFVEHAAPSTSFDDTKDIILILSSGIRVGFSLKCSTSIKTVLSKNMWAWSLIKTYFNSAEKQIEFNLFLDSERLIFLNSIFNTNFWNMRDANKFIVSKVRGDGYDKARFEYYPQASVNRDLFLKKLQLKLEEIVNELPIENILNAASLIMDSGGNIIYATYGDWNISANPSRHVNPIKDDYQSIRLRGNDTVVLVFSGYEVGFRYKFESSITKSIKLVWDYSFI